MPRCYLPVGCVLAVVASLAGAVRADDTAQKLQALLEGKAPSIVSVRAVVKFEIGFGGQSQNQETRIDAQGVVVDENGLVLVSNSHFSPKLPGMPAQFEVKATPIDLKVVVEKEEKEYDAFLAAKDTKLNLAFLQVKDLGDRKLRPVSFDESATVDVGHEVVAVGRLDKGYDYAPFFTAARISGKIRKPRRALMHSGALHELGLPVFTVEGTVVGVLTTLESGIKSEEQDAAGGFMQAFRMLSGGGLGAGASFILPGKSVKGIIGQAKKRAAEVAAEQAAEQETPDEDAEEKEEE